MSYTNPTVGNFKDYFVRDFPYGTDNTTVMDADITSALSDTAYFINPNLFESQGQYQIGFLNLAAHNLVMNLRASSQGVAGQYNWLNTGKSAGSVSGSFQIPQRIQDNPEFAILAETRYGIKFLMMILPALSAQCFAVCGRTNP